MPKPLDNKDLALNTSEFLLFCAKEIRYLIFNWLDILMPVLLTS